MNATNDPETTDANGADATHGAPENGPTLLVVHHSPTPLLRAVRDAALDGARHPDIEGVNVRVVEALDATAADVLAADAYLLGTSANFGYISGALKHFFDSTFAEVNAATEAGEIPKGRPVSWWIRGGYDVTGAAKAIRSLTTGFGWEIAAEPVEFVGDPDDAMNERLLELGGTMAALLMDAVGTDQEASR